MKNASLRLLPSILLISTLILAAACQTVFTYDFSYTKCEPQHTPLPATAVLPFLGES